MGQIFCKDCELPGKETLKQTAVTWGGVSWPDHDASYTSSTSNTDNGNSSLKSSPSSSNIDPKRSNRIKHKKRNVALHAEFRDRHGIEILAPPLCCERVMEDTDNVFCGQDLGVDTLHSNTTNGSVMSISSRHPLLGSATSSSSTGGTNGATPERQKQRPQAPPIKFEKTPEEDAFLDEALSDEDNFVFEGVPDHLRQKLKDNLERISVPKNTMIIRKGDEADYLYLLFQGEIAVYIDPDEYMDDNAVEIGKHAPIDISLKSERSSVSSFGSFGVFSGGNTNTKKSPVQRDFKQSYVLNLRQSLFGGNDDGSKNLLGQIFSMNRDVRDSTRMSALSANASFMGLMDETTVYSEDDGEASLTLLNGLKGLKHERDLGPGDVFGELSLIYNCTRTASCVTTTDCIIYRCNADSFRAILSSSNSDRVKKRCSESKAALEALHNVGVVEELDETTLKELGTALTPITFNQGDRVITKGAPNNLMFFVMQGKVFVHDIGTGDSRKVDIELGEGGHFGEMDLLFGGRSLANVTVVTPKVKLMVISKKDFKKR